MRSKEDRRTLYICSTCENDAGNHSDDGPHLQQHQRLTRNQQPRTLKYYLLQQKRLWIYFLSLLITVIIATPSILRRIVIVSAFTIPVTVKRSLQKIIVTVIRSPKSGILRTVTPSKQRRQQQFWSLQLTPYEEYMNSRRESEQQQQQQSSSDRTTPSNSNIENTNDVQNGFREDMKYTFVPPSERIDTTLLPPVTTNQIHNNHQTPIINSVPSSSPQDSPWNRDTKVYTFMPQRKQEEAPNNGHLNDTSSPYHGSTSTLGGSSNGMYRNSPSNAFTTTNDSAMPYSTVFPTNHHAPSPPASSINESNHFSSVVHDSNPVSNIGPNVDTDAARSCINEDTREGIQYERNDSNKSTSTPVPNSWDSYYNHQNQQNNMPQSTVSTNVPSAAAIPPASLESQMLPDRHYSMGENADNGTGFVASTEDQSMRTSEPVLLFSTSSNNRDTENCPATVVPPSSSTLQDSNSLWNESIASQSKSVNDERHNQHDPTMNPSTYIDEQQHRTSFSDQTVADNFNSRNLELEGNAKISQQQLPNIATYRTDHMIPELRGDNHTNENHDNGSNVHKVNELYASATSNQENVATVTSEPFSVQRSPEHISSTLSNEDSKEVTMAATLTRTNIATVIETSTPDEFRNTIDQTNFQRQSAPIIQRDDQKSQNAFGTTIPATLPQVPSLEVVSQIREDPRTNPDDRSSFDVISMHREESNTAINIELPQKPSFENIGPVTPTTTMLFATTLISCDEDIKCDSAVNNEKNLLESHQEESQHSTSMEMQIELAEAMFAKSDYPLGTFHDNNDQPATSTTARRIERRDSGQSHVQDNLTFTPADRELTSSPMTTSCLGMTSNNFGKTESISSFGQIVSTMSTSGTRAGNPRYEKIEREKNQMDVKWTEKLECSAPEINNAGMVDTKAPPPMLSVEQKMSIGSIEYPLPTKNLDVRGMTERIMKKIDGATQGSNMYLAFKQLESEWARVKQQSRFKAASSALRDAESSRPRTPFVTSDAVLGNPRCWAKLREHAHSATTDYDIIIHGGTQGIMLALALLRRNPTFRVCVVDSVSKMCIDHQEWNVSSTEFNELVKLGILNEPDVQDIILSKLPSGRFGFQNNDKAQLKGEYFGYDSAEDEVSTLCLSSSLLVERVTESFRQAGGVILEGTKIYGITVSTTVGAALDIGEPSEPITTKLLIDCAGKSSPILSQQQASAKPDGLCAIVGTRAAGYGCPQQTRGDVVYTMATMNNDFSNGKLQYFSEAPTAELDDRVIYMLTFMDADQDRQSFESLMDDYWNALPKYQPGIVNPEMDLNIKQLVLTYFPTYAISPLQPQFDRIVSIGDAFSTESPLCFGSLGAQCRHLGWFTSAINAVFDKAHFDKSQLAEIYTYAPILSSAWMYQQAAAIKMKHLADKSFVKQLLSVKMETTTQQTNLGQSEKFFQENRSMTPHSGQQMQPIHSHYGSKIESCKSHELSKFPNDQSSIDERTIQKKFDTSEPNSSSIATKESYDIARLNDSTINSNVHVVPMETSEQGTIGSPCSLPDQRTTFGSTENSGPIDQTISLPETSIQTQYHSGTTKLTEHPQTQQLHNFGFERSTSTAVEKELGSQDEALPIKKEHFENPVKQEKSSFDASVWGGQPGTMHMNTECTNRNGREIKVSPMLKENSSQSYGASQIENISPQRHPNVYPPQNRHEPLETKDHTHQEGKSQASLFEVARNTGANPPNHGFGISQSDSSVVATKSMYDNSSGYADSLAQTDLNKMETMRSDASSSSFDRNSDRHSISNIHNDHDVVSTPSPRATEEHGSESVSCSTIPSTGAPRATSVQISSQETWNDSNTSNRSDPATFSTISSQNTNEQYSNSNAPSSPSSRSQSGIPNRSGERLQSVQSYLPSDGLRNIGHRQDSSTEGVGYQEDIFPNVHEPTMEGTEISKSNQIRGYSYENMHDESDRRSTYKRYDSKANDSTLSEHDHSTIVSQQGYSPVPSYVDTQQPNNDRRTTEPMQTYLNNRQPPRKETSSHPYHYSTSHDGYASHPTSYAAVESNPNMQNVQQLGVSSMPDQHSTIESHFGYGSIPKSSAQSDREYEPNLNASSPFDQHAQTTTTNHGYFPAPTSSEPAEKHPHIQQHHGNLPLTEQNTGSSTQHAHASDPSNTVPTQSYSEQYQQRQGIPISSFQGQETEPTPQHEHTPGQTLHSQMQQNYSSQQQHEMSALQIHYTNRHTPTPSQSGHASVPTSTTPVTQYSVEQYLPNQHTNQHTLLQSQRGHTSVPTSTAPVSQHTSQQHPPNQQANQQTLIQSQNEHASVPTWTAPVSQYAGEQQQQQQQSHHAHVQVGPSVASLQPNPDGSGRHSLNQPYHQFTSAAPAPAPYDDGFSRYRLSQNTASILPDKGMGSASSNSRR